MVGTPSSPPTPGYDPHAAALVIARAVDGAGGPSLALAVFARLPGVVHIERRQRMFRSEPEYVLIGDWRYHVRDDGRIGTAHVVNEIALADFVLDAVDVGPHLAGALGQVLARFGPAILPQVDAALEVLATSR